MWIIYSPENKQYIVNCPINGPNLSIARWTATQYYTKQEAERDRILLQKRYKSKLIILQKVS